MVASTPHSTRKKNSTLQDFLQGAFLYVACICLPTILGLAVRLYEEGILSHPTDLFNTRNSSQSTIIPPQRSASYFSSNSIPAVKRWIGGVYNTVSSHLFLFEPYNPDSKISQQQPKSDLVNAIRLIIITSLLLALIRICLVYFLVVASPNRTNDSEKMSRFMRCKSYNLLSELDTLCLSPPGKTKSLGSFEREAEERTSRWERIFQRRNNNNNNNAATSSPFRAPPLLSPSNSFKHIITHNELTTSPRFATALFRLLYTLTSSLFALVLFHSANFWPRYLLGTSQTSSTKNCWNLSGTIGLLGYYDNDFDHFNQKLRHYFIVTASYHLQSLCFHIISLLFLILYDEETQKMKWISMKSSMKSYARPLMEHMVSLLLISGCFLFSSLRRLGAVGIFTLDISSMFLHLLDVGLHFPTTDGNVVPGMGLVQRGDDTGVGKRRFWRKEIIVKFVHRVLVIPSFLYCRFFIFPFIIWYSAMYESHEWLEQIEQAIIPGWGKWFFIVSNTLLMVILGLNLIFFKRLLFHPGLKKIFRGMRT